MDNLINRATQLKIDRIVKSLNDLNRLSRKGELKPFDLGNKRMDLLFDGLSVLAKNFNFPARIRYLSTGEIAFSGDLNEPFLKP